MYWFVLVVCVVFHSRHSFPASAKVVFLILIVFLKQQTYCLKNSTCVDFQQLKTLYTVLSFYSANIEYLYNVYKTC